VTLLAHIVLASPLGVSIISAVKKRR
jgi:hypothetical protein